MQQEVSFNEKVDINYQDKLLAGKLVIPDNSRALIIFADDSGNSIKDIRNQKVAESLQKEGFATLQFEMLTENELREENQKLDINFLAKRISSAYHWAKTNPQTEHFNIGLFGFNTGAAAAIIVATESENNINAVVSLSGRPDLVLNELELIRTPVLLIVGGADNAVVTYNQKALPHIRQAESRINVLQDSGHGFTDKHKLSEVAKLTRDWFIMHV